MLPDSGSSHTDGKTRADIRVKSQTGRTFSVMMSEEIIGDNDILLGQAVREELKTNDVKVLDAMNVAPLPEGIVRKVMEQCSDGEVYQGVANEGGIYILYEILMQTLVASESVLEFIARSIDYFKSLVYRKLSNRAKKNFFRENATLQSSVRMMRTIIDDVLVSIQAMIDKTNIEFDNSFVRNTLMKSWEATLCITELEDSFRFRKVCLEAQLSECEKLVESMQHQIDLIAMKEQMNLNLVATTFLPLTFWAGVFGMNFYEDGGSTIEILNRKKGPLVFMGICLGSFLITFIMFCRSGMVDTSSFSVNSLQSPSAEDVAFDESVMRLKEQYNDNKQSVHRASKMDISHASDNDTSATLGR